MIRYEISIRTDSPELVKAVALWLKNKKDCEAIALDTKTDEIFVAENGNWISTGRPHEDE